MKPVNADKLLDIGLVLKWFPNLKQGTKTDVGVLLHFQGQADMMEREEVELKKRYGP